MNIQDKYLIGFDRFVDLNWVNQAYFIAKHDIELSKKTSNQNILSKLHPG